LKLANIIGQGKVKDFSMLEGVKAMSENTLDLIL